MLLNICIFNDNGVLIILAVRNIFTIFSHKTQIDIHVNYAQNVYSCKLLHEVKGEMCGRVHSSNLNDYNTVIISCYNTF